MEPESSPAMSSPSPDISQTPPESSFTSPPAPATTYETYSTPPTATTSPSDFTPPTPAVSSTPAPSLTQPPSLTPAASLTPPPSLTPASAPSDGMSSGTLIGVVIGTVFGSLLMLIFVGICAFFCKRRKRRWMRQHELENYSTAPPQQANADQFGGPPQHWQQTISPPTNGGTTLLPKPTSPPGVGLNQQPSSMHSTTSTSLESERPYRAPSPGIALGLLQISFTYEELAFATNGFSNSNLLGQGGFGYVHKGVLPNGKTVAIKQLKSGSRQGEREFQAEVEVISRVHHRHLVSLVGYCIAGDQRMLVYEFVPNNTLEFHLHGKDRATMDWATRMKIAIGSAKGLAYLHEDCQPKIIHRDIKASNILLDDNFDAKVADFGLAKILSDNDTHVSTRVMGTFGYLAPEYAASGKFTDKSDVFSFGVMLLELITGRKPVDKTESFTDDSMVEWARPFLSQALENGNFDVLADPKLQKSYNSDEVVRMIACAANCVRYSARHRPRMSQVVRALEGNISLDDLNEGSTPVHSRAFSSYESSGYGTGQYNEDLKKFRKLALDQGTSEYSGPSSEFGQHQSASSSSGQ